MLPLKNTLFGMFLLGFFTSKVYSQEGKLDIRPHPIVSERRLNLTKDYCHAHYGLDSYALKDPQIVVIHYTALPTLKQSISAFEPDEMPKERKYLQEFGNVNVGVHFLVDKNGTVYSLLPLDVIGRHAIGLNHISIGIENVGQDAASLTEKQVATNAELVKYLMRRFSSIKYLIGHFEYTKKDREHYQLFKELIPGYKPTNKIDPGPDFMKRLRARLKQDGIVLKD